MRLTFWTKTGLVAVAIIATALAVLSTSAPASCGDADDSRTSGLLVQAAKSYANILADEPTSTCAATGMKQLCERATDLRSDGLTMEANTVWKAMLGHEPVPVPSPRSDEAKRCAEEGIRATTPAPDPPPGTMTIISGPPGPKGEDGQDGQDGKAGARGAAGVAGPAGASGKDGQDGRPGLISKTIIVCRKPIYCKVAG
jgi:hypothetical protein